MSADGVVEEILSSAREKASAILRDAKKEAREIIRRAEEEAKQYEESFKAETEKILEEMEKSEIASAKLEASKIRMNAKKRIMEDFLNSVLEEITLLKEKEDLLKSLAEKVKEEIEVGKIYCNEEEKKIIRKLFPKTKISCMMCKGGFIVESRDGEVSIDLTYETLLRNMKRKILKILEKELESV